MKCPYPDCGHEWENRVEKPQKCPKCQRPLAYPDAPRVPGNAQAEEIQEKPPTQTIPVSNMPMRRQTPRYRMRFVPYTAEGALKKNTPAIGNERGPEPGEIWGLPIEQRHEIWWELVDESEVPPEELARDQKKRDLFMAAAKISEAERAKNMRAARVPIR